ncbi:hypothetical protein M8J77_000063 [Diaphorina citri]|nr:hypothetical protein M8J77_000063 [Diaphorina citri]
MQLKRPPFDKEKLLFHHDNVPAHTSTIVKAKLHHFGYELLVQPPYSTNLTPCDYSLFLNLKIWIRGKRFTSNNDVITQKTRYFEEFDGSCYSEGFKMWQGRWVKCVALKVD